MAWMKNTALALSGALALTLGAARVTAQSNDVTASNRADAQCLAVFTLIFSGDTASLPDDAQSGGMVLIGYYLGRIEARTPDVDLSALLKDVVMTDMAEENAMDTIALRCASEAEVIADRMVKTGESLENFGQ